MTDKKNEKDKGEQKSELPSPRFYIVKEQAGGGAELVFRVDGTRSEPKTRYLMRTDGRLDSLDVILKEMCANVLEVRPETPGVIRMLAEALHGEAEWRYGNEEDGYKYKFGREAKRLYPEPPKAEEPKLAEESTPALLTELNGRPLAGFSDRICPIHNIPKLRNGCRECRREQARNGGQSSGVRNPVCPRHGQKTKDGMKHGHQQYRCVPCLTENPPAGENPLRLVEHSYEDFCKHHNQKKYKNGVEKRTGKQKYRCPECLRANKGKPPADAWKNWSGEELLEHFTAVVRKHGGGHNLQDTEDIVSSLIAVLHEETRTFEELHQPEIVRLYVRATNRLSADGRTTLDLDAPVGMDEKHKMTFADTKPAADSDPHEQLEAKEAVTARLNGGGGDEFVAPVIERAHEGDRSNGHSSQQDKFERPSLDAPVSEKEPDGQIYTAQHQSSALTLEEELIAKEASGPEQ